MTNGGAEHKFRDKTNARSGYCFLTNEQLQEFQINEANIHQLAVDHGKCWQVYPAFNQTNLPSSSVVSPRIELRSGCAEELPGLVWTDDEKSTFIELVGRWTASALPEIAEHIHKPLFECQTYLDMLKSHPRCIDMADIPAAEEVPLENTEFDIENGISSQPAIDSPTTRGTTPKSALAPAKPESSKLFNRLQLESRLGTRFLPADLAHWESVLVEKLTEWITEFMKLYRIAGGICRDQTPYLHQVFENDRRVNNEIHRTQSTDLGSDREESMESYLSPNSFRQPYVHPIKRRKLAGDDDQPDTDVLLTALSDEEDTESELIDQETEYLELFDQFNSMHSLLARGLPASSAPPPPPRPPELEEFMCRRS